MNYNNNQSNLYNSSVYPGPSPPNNMSFPAHQQGPNFNVINRPPGQQNGYLSNNNNNSTSNYNNDNNHMPAPIHSNYNSNNGNAYGTLQSPAHKRLVNARAQANYAEYHQSNHQNFHDNYSGATLGVGGHFNKNHASSSNLTNGGDYAHFNGTTHNMYHINTPTNSNLHHRQPINNNDNAINPSNLHADIYNLARNSNLNPLSPYSNNPNGDDMYARSTTGLSYNGQVMTNHHVQQQKPNYNNVSNNEMSPLRRPADSADKMIRHNNPITNNMNKHTPNLSLGSSTSYQSSSEASRSQQITPLSHVLANPGHHVIPRGSNQLRAGNSIGIDTIEASANDALCGAVMTKLRSFTRLSECVIAELHALALGFYNRSINLQTRIDKASMALTMLERRSCLTSATTNTTTDLSPNDVMDASDHEIYKAIRANTYFNFSITTKLDGNQDLRSENTCKTAGGNFTIDQQIVRKNTMPAVMRHLYLSCDAPPPLAKLNKYRDDGKDASKFYTDPEYFFDLWKLDMMFANPAKNNQTVDNNTTLNAYNMAGPSDTKVNPYNNVHPNSTKYAHIDQSVHETGNKMLHEAHNVTRSISPPNHNRPTNLHIHPMSANYPYPQHSQNTNAIENKYGIPTGHNLQGYHHPDIPSLGPNMLPNVESSSYEYYNHSYNQMSSQSVNNSGANNVWQQRTTQGYNNNNNNSLDVLPKGLVSSTVGDKYSPITQLTNFMKDFTKFDQIRNDVPHVDNNVPLSSYQCSGDPKPTFIPYQHSKSNHVNYEAYNANNALPYKNMNVPLNDNNYVNNVNRLNNTDVTSPLGISYNNYNDMDYTYRHNLSTGPNAYPAACTGNSIELANQLDTTLRASTKNLPTPFSPYPPPPPPSFLFDDVGNNSNITKSITNFPPGMLESADNNSLTPPQSHPQSSQLTSRIESPPTVPNFLPPSIPLATTPLIRNSALNNAIATSYHPSPTHSLNRPSQPPPPLPTPPPPPPPPPPPLPSQQLITLTAGIHANVVPSNRNDNNNATIPAVNNYETIDDSKAETEYLKVSPPSDDKDEEGSSIRYADSLDEKSSFSNQTSNNCNNNSITNNGIISAESSIACKDDASTTKASIQSVASSNSMRDDLLSAIRIGVQLRKVSSANNATGLGSKTPNGFLFTDAPASSSSFTNTSQASLKSALMAQIKSNQGAHPSNTLKPINPSSTPQTLQHPRPPSQQHNAQNGKLLPLINTTITAQPASSSLNSYGSSGSCNIMMTPFNSFPTDVASILARRIAVEYTDTEEDDENNNFDYDNDTFDEEVEPSLESNRVSNDCSNNNNNKLVGCKTARTAKKGPRTGGNKLSEGTIKTSKEGTLGNPETNSLAEWS